MCIFCDLQKEHKTTIVQNELSYAVYDIYPDAPGHMVIIPKRCIETMFLAKGEEWASVGELINLAKAEIEKTHKPKGYKIIANCGAAAGQTVFHAHVHLLPKY